jgi:hypothetical protein
LLRTAVFYYDSRPIEHCYVDFELPRPNHAMQPTPKALREQARLPALH